MSDLQQKFNALLKVNEQLLEANKELAAALAGKDEALQFADKALDVLKPNCHEAVWVKEALALQPHASLVAKIKAEAVMTQFADYEILTYADAKAYADRIERGEVK